MHRLLAKILLVVLALSATLYGSSEASAEPKEAHEVEHPSLIELLSRGADVALLKDRKLPAGISLGTTSSGHLSRGKTLPDSKNIAVLPTHQARDRRYAATNLQRLLLHTSDVLARSNPNAPRLMIGDISALKGGDISGHRSHNSGRDVDIAFFYLDAKGHAIEAPGMVSLRRNGRGKGGLKMDIPRTWEMVAAMLSSPEADMQYLFIYDPLRQKILQHAKDIDAPQQLIDRASKVLRQPSDSAPHRDHFHARVFCSARDRTEGCLNRGPLWSWANLHDKEHSTRAYKLAEILLKETDPQRKKKALRFLKKIEATEATPMLARALIGASPTQQNLLLDAISKLSPTPESAPHLFLAIHNLKDPPKQNKALSLIGRAQNPNLIGPLARLVEQTQHSNPKQALHAARALAKYERRELISTWISWLNSPEKEIRSSALKALQQMSNRATSQDDTIISRQNTTKADAAIESWRQWWSKAQTNERDQWLLKGFKAQGVQMKNLEDSRAIPALIELQTKAPRPIANNANRVLVKLTGHWRISEKLRPQTRQKRWLKWWRKNKKRF